MLGINEFNKTSDRAEMRLNSRMSRKMKILLVVILAIGSVVFYLFKDEKGEDEIYLVPEGYQGAVFIVFNQHDGVNKKYEKGKRVYEIPSNGILKTKFELNKGWHQLPLCFYVNKQTRTPVKYYQFGEEVKGGDTIQACCSSAGVYYKNSNNQAVDYDVFFIGTEAVIDSAYEARMKVDLSKYLGD
jgi:hypothetical protein